MSTSIAPRDVISTIREHLIGDGFEFVLDLKKSSGSRLYDSLADRYLLDFYSCFASNPIGFNHPKMADQVFKERLHLAALNNVTNSDLFTEMKAQFVKTFYRIAAPARLPHLFMVAGGALGIENAIKAAFDWKAQLNHERGDTRGLGTRILHLRKAFHGRTGYTMSLTNTDPVKTERFPKFDWPRIDAPAVRFPDEGAVHEDLLLREKRALKQARHAIHHYGPDLAACIVEPIQGEGGDNHFRGEFLHELQNLCRENDILFIVDEVQTGVGLTGSMWAYEQFGLEPDMLCFGKKMQVCGFLCSTAIDRVEHNVFNTSGRINSTWGGNLVDMVRAERYLEIIAEDDLVGNARQVGEILLKELHTLQARHAGKVSNARGRGLMCAFDLPSTAERNDLRKRLFDAGLLVLNSGERSIRFRPALNLTAVEAAEGVAIIDRALG
ncbi:MAG: L-lysine 6-transaminase [Calditrichaeota bacterium]|nr:L-lysine 6-transaminase [Calditrichota bacterium]